MGDDERPFLLREPEQPVGTTARPRRREREGEGEREVLRGCLYVSLYFFPPPAAPSVRTGLVCEGRDGGQPHEGSISPAALTRSGLHSSV